MSDNVVRPYKSFLKPDARKRELLDITFNWFDRAYKKFFDVFVALYGGIDYETVHSALLKEGTDPDLVCATMWFRVVPKSSCDSISSQEMIRRFDVYAGHEPSSIALSYLTGNFDAEKNHWVDCRERFISLARDMVVKPESLLIDIKSMVEHNILPICPQDNWQAWNAISQLFGEGKKENKAEKAQIFVDVVSMLSNNSVQTWEDYKEVISKATGCNTAGEINAKFGGRPGILSVDFSKQDTGSLPKDFIEKRIKDLDQKAKEKSAPYELPNRMRLRELIASVIGPYRLENWSSVAQRACGDIRSKNSNNLLYSSERFNRTKEIEDILTSCDDVAKAQEILGQFRSGEFNEFAVEKRHLGNLESLYKIWSNSDMDAGIEEYSSIHKDEYDRDPIVDLYRHIYPHREVISAKNFIDAAVLNKLLRLNASKYVHPTVFGKTVISFAPKSSAYGKITPPSQIVRGRPAGSHGMIWVTMELFDNGKWVRHHLPFHNSRYYEEVYCYQEGLPVKDEPRSPMFGYRVGNKIADASKIDNRRRKASKQFLRAQQNIEHNVFFDENTAFNVARNGGDYSITISSRLKAKKAKSLMKIGDRIMGIDQNQTAANSYSIWEVVGDGELGSIKHGNLSLKRIEDGQITSIVYGRGGKFDQLNYGGLSYSHFSKWRSDRLGFISSLNVELVSKMNWDWCGLYEWNARYASSLKKIIYSHKGIDIERVFRQEIENFVEGVLRTGSLSSTALQCLTNAKSLISSYFYLNGKKEPEEQRQFDQYLFDLSEKIDNKRVNKRQQKTKRIMSSIMQIAHDRNVSFIVVEGKLSTATKDNKSKANQRTIDWCARSVVENLEHACSLVGVKLVAVDPMNTSHLDPFVYVLKTSLGKEARFATVAPSKINFRHVKSFKTWSSLLAGNGKSKKTTDAIYVGAFQDFCKEYGFSPVEISKMSESEIQGKLISHQFVLVPQRGGRVYMSTHPVSSDAKKIVYAGRERWYNNADVVAAVNITLRGCDRLNASRKA